MPLIQWIRQDLTARLAVAGEADGASGAKGAVKVARGLVAACAGTATTTGTASATRALYASATGIGATWATLSTPGSNTTLRIDGVIVGTPVVFAAQLHPTITLLSKLAPPLVLSGSVVPNILIASRLRAPVLMDARFSAVAYVGSDLTLSFTTVLASSGALYDPSTLQVRYRMPGALIVTATQATGDLVRDSTGTYHVVLPAPTTTGQITVWIESLFTGQRVTQQIIEPVYPAP